MIKYQGDSFAYIDELEYFRKIYSALDYRPKEVFYEIDAPFKMDSQANAQQQNGKLKRIRRKRKSTKAPQFLLKNCALVYKSYECFLNAVNTLSTSADSLVNNNNNKHAREAVKNSPTFDYSLCCDSKSLDFVELIHGANHCIRALVLFKNPANFPIFVHDSSTERKFILPSKSEFINGDLRMLRHLCHQESKFHLIVADPPWPNKSIKRKKSYAMFNQIDDLAQLPIMDLLAENGLLCVWMSNNETVHSKTRQILLEEWSLVELATWHWMKVCRINHRPVVDFNPEHKVPFESLIFVCREHSKNTFAKITTRQNFTLIGVPNANPSRKPPILPILRELNVLEDSDDVEIGKNLELFARYLVPEMLSIGLEAIKFQDNYFFDYFEKK